VAIAALVFMGVCSISFIATANATIQLQADPAMRGRVMALYAIAFLGSTPIGAPLLGFISDTSNPRVALIVGGVATVAASIPLFYLATRQQLVRSAAGASTDEIAVPADEESNIVPLPLAGAEELRARRTV
jgi:MFS family permease